MQRLDQLSAAVLVAVAAAGCQPEVLLASSEPEAGGGGASGASAAGAGGVAGMIELPTSGEGGSATPEPPRLLADSIADFSLTQEERGWSYGYDLGSLETFALLTRKSVITNYVPASNDVWDCWANDTAHWTQVFQLGAHPNGTETSTPSNAVLQRAVRRWTSNFAGDVTIAGEIAKIDLATNGGSNGVEAFIYVDGTQVYTTPIAAEDGGGRSYKVIATLQIGSTVDFVLDPHEGDDRHDLTRFTGVIVRVEPGPAL